MGQSSARGTADRKTSVPTGTRRAPTHVKSQTITPPVGAQAASGRARHGRKNGCSSSGSGWCRRRSRSLPNQKRCCISDSTGSPGSPGAVQHRPAGTPAAPSTSRITQMNAQKVQSGPVSGTTQAAERTGIAVGQTTQNTSSVTAQKPTSTPKALAASARPSWAGPRPHRCGRQIPVILSGRLKARLRRRSRVRPLPARQPFIRKARSTVRQERRPRRLLCSPHGNPGPAGMLLLREVQCRQRQGEHSPARQEAQHAPASPMPAVKNAAPNLHPGPAGTAAGDRQTTQVRQTARSTTSVPTATGSQAGMKAVSNTKAAVKEHAVPSATKQPTRKQRGKKK